MNHYGGLEIRATNSRVLHITFEIPIGDPQQATVK